MLKQIVEIKDINEIESKVSVILDFVTIKDNKEDILSDIEIILQKYKKL